MSKYIYIILTIISVYSSKSQSKNKNIDYCSGCFHAIGIKDFVLNSSKQEINDLLIPIEDEIELLDSYKLINTIKLNQNEYEIIYYFNFLDDSLKDYHFKIKGDRKLFEWVSEKLQTETMSGYANTSHKYSFFSENEFCKRYILFSRIAQNKEYIKGGVKSVD